MGKYGRFNGGTHFSYLKKAKIKTKKVIDARATEDQLKILKEHGLNFSSKQHLIQKSIELNNQNKKYTKSGENLRRPICPITTPMWRTLS